MKKKRIKLKIISMLLSVIMLVPYMSALSVATTVTANSDISNETVSNTSEDKLTFDTAKLSETLDISTVPDIIGAEAAQAAGHVQRAAGTEHLL